VGQKQCSTEGLSACGPDGQWQALTACEIGCDAAKLECVVPVQLVSGSDHACARLSDGTVRCWGSNSNGQLGTGDGEHKLRPTAVAGLAGVVDLAASFSATCAVTSAGAAFCWGKNNSGMFKPVTGKVQSPEPQPVLGAVRVALGYDHVCITNDQNVIFCRGDSGWGQCGTGSFGSAIAEYTAVKDLPGAPKQLGFGFRSSIALIDSLLYCWGDTKTSCPGIEDGVGPTGVTKPTLFSNVASVISLDSAQDSTCATKIDRRVACWGLNDYGQLGRGTLDPNPTVGAPALVLGLEDVVQVSVSLRNVCALKEGGKTSCWGSNQYNQLGRTCGELPCQTATDSTAYVPTPVAVPLDGAQELALGTGFACARTADAKVHCWGRNERGQLGVGKLSPAEVKPTPVVW
jgi:alpha-tubulin suppressor-like RCC1 family protein